jgi:hypothetical protein
MARTPCVAPSQATECSRTPARCRRMRVRRGPGPHRASSQRSCGETATRQRQVATQDHDGAGQGTSARSPEAPDPRAAAPAPASSRAASPERLLVDFALPERMVGQARDQAPGHRRGRDQSRPKPFPIRFAPSRSQDQERSAQARGRRCRVQRDSNPCIIPAGPLVTRRREFGSRAAREARGRPWHTTFPPGWIRMAGRLRPTRTHP